MQSLTTDLKKAIVVAKQLANRNQCTIFIFAIMNGRHETLYHELYLDGAKELKLFNREPDAKVLYELETAST